MGEGVLCRYLNFNGRGGDVMSTAGGVVFRRFRALWCKDDTETHMVILDNSQGRGRGSLRGSWGMTERGQGQEVGRSNFQINQRNRSLGRRASQRTGGLFCLHVCLLVMACAMFCFLRFVLNDFGSHCDKTSCPTSLAVCCLSCLVTYTKQHVRLWDRLRRRVEPTDV